MLVQLLVQDGYDVTTTSQAGLAHASDEEQLAYAILHGRILVTKNPADFLALHEAIIAQQQHHPGIVAVYQDNDKARDMSEAAIVTALRNVREWHQWQPVNFRDKYVCLNYYR